MMKEAIIYLGFNLVAARLSFLLVSLFSAGNTFLLFTTLSFQYIFTCRGSFTASAEVST